MAKKFDHNNRMVSSRKQSTGFYENILDCKYNFQSDNEAEFDSAKAVCDQCFGEKANSKNENQPNEN